MNLLDPNIREYIIKWESTGWGGSPEPGTKGKIENSDGDKIGKFFSESNKPKRYSLIILDSNENLILKIKEKSFAGLKGSIV